MKFTQYYLDCLSQASYLIGDETTGKAVVVDPRRDIDEYLADAKEAGLTIEYVIETHFHADFLSGHLEMAQATGAEIIYGEAADTEFACRKVADGERISLGKVELEFLATPGHTPESISIVVHDGEKDIPHAVLTGDTLFIGDVGRPDLLSANGLTADELGGMLYDSLHTKLMTLPDDTLLYPAHGAGSSCGKNLSNETVCTIGRQRENNYAVQPMSKEQFIAAVTDGQKTAPSYFSFDASTNRSDHELFSTDAPPPMTLDEIVAAQKAGAVVLDVRDNDEFAKAHLRGSVNAGLDGRFAEFVGMILRHDVDIIVVTPADASTEARTRLARIGFDRVIGALEAPEADFVANQALVERSSRITVPKLAEVMQDMPDAQYVDVRGPGEREGGIIEGFSSIPLPELVSRVSELDLSKPIVLHCAGGYRSLLAGSWLTSQGADDVTDLIGGYAAYARMNANLQETSS